MTDSPQKAPEEREPLAAQNIYQPVPTNQIVPHWERNIKFASLAALVVVAVVGYRYWKAQQPAPVVSIAEFPPATNGPRGTVSHSPLRFPAAAAWRLTHPTAKDPAVWLSGYSRSPEGNVLYYHSKRDGFHCIWAQKLGPGKKPAGDPIPIQHFHSAAFGLYLVKATEFSLAVGKDRLFLNAARDSGNIWMTRR